MIEMKVTIPSFNIVRGEVFPKTKAAIGQVASAIQTMWQDWVMGNEVENLPINKFPSTRLMASIKKDVGDFSAQIYTDDTQMTRIEHGSPEYDMKKTYPYGYKSRVNKKGTPYLIVPFRWGTGGKNDIGRAHFASTVPEYLVKLLRKRGATYRNEGTHFEPNARGEQVERTGYAKGRAYMWGGKLTKEDILPNTEHGERMRGMVRMGNSGGYFTFRIITPFQDAKKWIRKAVPAIPVIKTIAENNRDIAQKIIGEAVAEDIKAL